MFTHQSIKYNRGHWFTLLMVLTAQLLISVTAMAQRTTVSGVNISLSITPPYSPYYSDYYGINANKVLLILQNNSDQQVKIKLSGKFQGDNGILIATYSRFTPLAPVILNPHEVKQMTGLALKDVFDINNLSVTGIDRNKLAQTSRLPEGNYNLCLKALDYTTNALLSADAPLGCTNFTVSYPEPPVLISPMINAKVHRTPSQNIIFNWTNPGNVPIGTQYTLQIAEMPDVAADPNQVLNASSFPLLSQQVFGFSYVYNLMNVPLKTGKKYAWRVIAKNPAGRTVFRNNGISGAGVFIYGDDAPAQSVATRKPGRPVLVANNNLTISGVLKYKYRDQNGAVTLPAAFTGVKDDTIALSKADIQLCYGMCLAKLELKKHVENQVIGFNDFTAEKKLEMMGQGVTFVKKGKDSLTMTFTKTDSIPVMGQPVAPGISPAGNQANGLGEVIATTTTSAAGAFTFAANTQRAARIYGTYGDKALVYCYYINIKNKHYTDPGIFIYAPLNEDGASVNVGSQSVYAMNYNLQVTVKRDQEFSTNQGQKNGVSVENNADNLANVYILRKHTELSYKNSTNDNNLPATEGDNAGYVKFTSQSDKQPGFVKFDQYDIVAQKSAYTLHNQNGDNNFQANVKFYNLLNNLDTKDSYYIYTEYKGVGVYFEPVTYAHQTFALVPEYMPMDTWAADEQKYIVEPDFVSIKVKGVLKYKFNNSEPVPLANVNISLQSVLWSIGQKTPDAKFERILDGKNQYGENKTFGSATTSPDGSFEIDAGDISYSDYKVGNALVVGLSQYLIVNNQYYGSPDQEYYFEAGNTYNVGEIISKVKEYNVTATVSRPLPNNKFENLPGQRVYLMRLASVNPQQWGVPKDEGVQKGIPVKQINDAYNTYNVIGYGITDANGFVQFPRAVARDFMNNDDRYYLYSESGILSQTNYVTQFSVQADINSFNHTVSWLDYYKPDVFAFNKTFKTVHNNATQVHPTALPPYIEGGVYPFSNTSTNALSDVLVTLYDVSPSMQSTLFDGVAQNFGVDMAMKLYGITGSISKYMTYQTEQTTGSTALFRFENLTAYGTKNGWKLLVYSKSGFISGYTIINSGKPMTDGVKQNVKGFIYPPQQAHVTVKDSETGQPIEANIVVGNQFSWASQKVLTSTVFKNGHYEYVVSTPGANLTTPYGDVSFTVIPEDMVRYKAQIFKHNMIKPTGNKDVDEVQQLGTFEMVARKNRINVCVMDAATNKAVPYTIRIADVADNVNPAKVAQFSLKGECKSFAFVSNQSSYHIIIGASGYANYTQLVYNNTYDDDAKDIFVKLKPDMKVTGIVKLDGKPVANAKVYVRQLKNIADVYTETDGSYTINGLPQNEQTVTISAVIPSKNVIGEDRDIVLSSLTSSGDPAPSQGGNGGSYKPGSNGKVNGSLNIGTGKTFTANYANTGSGKININGIITLNFSLQTNNEFDLSNLYGFPLEVENLDLSNAKTGYLTGRIKIAGNEVFGFNQPEDGYLHFTKIAIPRGSGSNKLAPAPAMVTADDDDIPIRAFNTYGATLKGFSNGIRISSGGNIGATVALSPNNIVGNVALTSDVTLLPSNSKPEITEAPYDAFVTNNMIFHPVDYTIYTFKSPISTATIAPYYTFSCGNGIGSPYAGLHYFLNSLYYTSAAGYLANDGLHLTSTIHTNLQNVAKPDIAYNIGEVHATNKVMDYISSKKPLEIALDDWSIKADKWSINNGSLHLDGKVDMGSLTVPFNGLEVSNNSIGFGDLKLDGIAIAGVQKLNIDQSATLTAFGYDKAAAYGTYYNKKYGCWSLSLLPKNPDGVLTEIAGLQDLAQGNTIQIMNISLYSKGGESRVMLKQNHPALFVNNVADFVPYEAENGKDYLRINGALSFKIPGFTGTENTPYSLDYKNVNNTLAHVHNPISGLKLTTNGVRVEFGTDGQVFNKNVLALSGILRDKVPSSPYEFHVGYRKDDQTNNLKIDEAAKDSIAMGQGQRMKGIMGNMALANNGSWNNFQFEGDVTATGMSAQKPSHMNFEIKGDLVANKAKIGVENMDLPNGLGKFNITYDFPKKAIVGSLRIDSMKTPVGSVQADMEMQIGGGLWFILGSAVIKKVSQPLPLNGGSGAFLVGNCDVTPHMLEIIKPVFHNSIMPDGFDTDFKHIKGSLLVAGVDIKLPILPTLDVDVVVANVSVHYGVYANAYLGLSFANGLSNASITGGVKVGAYVNVNAGASLGLVCAGVSLSADVNATGKLIMTNLDFTDLNPVAFYQKADVTLSLKPEVTLQGSAYIGYGVCNSSCGSVKVWGVKIPPGCHKTNIGGDLKLSMIMSLYKPTSYLSPNKADVSAHFFGKDFYGKLNIPALQ